MRKSRSTAPCVAAKAARASSTEIDVHEASSHVILRLKRKRTDNPVERLVVQSEPNLKRSKTDLLEAFTQLSTSEDRFVFKHIDTMEESVALGHVKWVQRLKRKVRTLKKEHAAKKQLTSAFQNDFTASKLREKHVKQQQSRCKARRNEEMLKSRGLQPLMEIKEKQTLELHGIRLVDLQVSNAPSSNTEEENVVGLEKSKNHHSTKIGATLTPTRVLNPYERELDEAIWTAFRANDFAPFFRIYHAQRSEHCTDPTTFQRLADGSTILMAAAMHGRSDVIEVLLRSVGSSVLQRDWEGATATVFAKRGGHTNVERALRACEEAENEKDYVYDVYCVDLGASEKEGTLHDATTVLANDSKHSSLNGVPVVNVSSDVHRWLSEDLPSENVEEYMLESDLDSSEEDGLSEDSNDEDNVANDYPDEESSDESLADSDDPDELIGAKGRWQPHDNEFSERDDYDY